MGVLHEPAGGVVPTAPAGTSAAPDGHGKAATAPAGHGPAGRGARRASAKVGVPLGAGLTPSPAIPGSRELVRRLERGGLASREAGNVVAYLVGLKPVASGWRVAEIEHLRFLRALAADGRLES
jgi:hypothetical protein